MRPETLPSGILVSSANGCAPAGWTNSRAAQKRPRGKRRFSMMPSSLLREEEALGVPDLARRDAGDVAALGVELLAVEGDEVDRRDVERREARLAGRVGDDCAREREEQP